jgi:hypothetical protein
MKRLLPLFLALALVSCSSGDKGPPPCPEVGFMEDAGKAVFFASANPTEADISVRAALPRMSVSCEMSRHGAEVKLGIDIAAERLPPAKGLPKQNLSYFIAAVGPEDQVIRRENYYAAMDFAKGDKAVQTVEHEFAFPVAEPAKAWGYKVLVGFTLTPEQLAFNRGVKLPPPPQPAKKPARGKKQPAKKS